MVQVRDDGTWFWEMAMDTEKREWIQEIFRDRPTICGDQADVKGETASSIRTPRFLF